MLSSTSKRGSRGTQKGFERDPILDGKQVSGRHPSAAPHPTIHISAVGVFAAADSVAPQGITTLDDPPDETHACDVLFAVRRRRAPSDNPDPLVIRHRRDATLTVTQDARAAYRLFTPSAPPGGLVRADGGPLRLLVIDGEQLSGELISIALRHEGWLVLTARDGAGALAMARDEKPDMIVLDNALPDADGLSVMRSIRALRRSIPVVILGSRTDDRDRIEALAQGGDDYIAKPFDVNEVVLRLSGLAKRARVGFPIGLRVVGDLTLNEFTHEVTRAGHPVSLTATEFKVLRLLIRNAGQIVSKAQILQEVWGDDSEVGMNVVEIFISYVRRKIDPDRPPLIHTVRGCGYMLKLR